MLCLYAKTGECNMKKQIIAGILISFLSVSVFACQDERDTKKAEAHRKMHEQTLSNMSKEDKASYEKVSKMVDEFSESEKKALHVKLRDEYMMLSKEEKIKLHKQHKEHMNMLKEQIKKEAYPAAKITPQQEKDMKNDMKEPLRP